MPGLGRGNEGIPKPGSGNKGDKRGHRLTVRITISPEAARILQKISEEVQRDKNEIVSDLIIKYGEGDAND